MQNMMEKEEDLSNMPPTKNSTTLFPKRLCEIEQAFVRMKPSHLLQNCVIGAGYFPNKRGIESQVALLQEHALLRINA